MGMTAVIAVDAYGIERVVEDTTCSWVGILDRCSNVIRRGERAHIVGVAGARDVICASCADRERRWWEQWRHRDGAV